MITARSFLPNTAVLELTYRCNHGCLFCSCPWYAGMIPQEKEMGTEEWKALIREFADAGVTQFAFTGGEAMLRPDLEELLRFAVAQTVYEVAPDDSGELTEKSISPHINFLSNGRLMSEKWLNLCRELNLHLSLSLPGLNTYRELTDSDTDPQSILAGFRQAKELGITTTAGVTVTSKNFYELAETLSEALLSGADSILLNRFLPGGRGLLHRELELTPEQTVEMTMIAERILRKARRKGGVGTELPACLVPRPELFTALSLSTHCGAAKSFMVVGPSGKIRVCNHSPVELVHWRDWRSLKDHPYWKRFIFSDYLPSECDGCEDQSHCDGGCREAAHVCFGNPAAVDPVLAHLPDTGV